MAKVELLIQGFTDSGSQKNALINLLNYQDIKRFITCSAFVREDGVLTIKNHLKRIGSISTAYIGIRNGVTSVQGLISLLKSGITVYVIDTGSLAILYHPKIYCVFNDLNALTLIGSTNLTFSGLVNNIESSALIDLNLQDDDDKRFLLNLVDTFDILPQRFPDHIFQIRTIKDAVKLLIDGRVTDERAKLQISSGNKKTKRSYQKIKRINLPIHKKIPKIRYSHRKHTRLQKVQLGPESFDLVWDLPSLKRRHLQIPLGNTNPTGSLSLGKGALTEVDQTTYFRKEVFSDVDWTTSPFDIDKETASANFELIISGISYGIFNLLVSHNPRFESGQRNYTTSIHWGAAKEYIAREELLGRELRLYKNKVKPNEFIIEID